MNNHTTAPIGKRIHVILWNKKKFVDKLISINSKYYGFETHGHVPKKTVRSFSISR